MGSDAEALAPLEPNSPPNQDPNPAVLEEHAYAVGVVGTSVAGEDLRLVSRPPSPLAVLKTMSIPRCVTDNSALFSVVLGSWPRANCEEVMRDGVLTLKEVAVYLKVTERTIYRIVGDRKISAFKVGGSWRFRLAEIDAWIKAQLHEVKSDEDDQ